MSVTQTIANTGDGYTPMLDSVRNLATAAGNYVDKMQSFMGMKGSSSHIRDLYTNGFLAQDSIYNPNFFVRAFDEPTYLTFRIEFITDPTETQYRNTAYNNNGAIGGYRSWLYSTMFDYMPEPFLEDFSISGKRDSSLGRMYSTEGYLDMNLGDHGRAAMLHNFKAALKDIENNFPYYFKSVSGLQSLTMVDPTYGARLKDAELTIECEEGLDLKITQLINMYRKIVWDDTYQRWVLPDMMRYFGMRIYISEIRLFHSMEKRNVNLKGNPSVYDFTNTKIRNATHLPLDNKDLWETANNAVATGTAISNAFLGTNSYITEAVNRVGEMMNTASTVISGIDDIMNDLMLCNNAINDVMPTLCFECHMCEFDISNSLDYIGSMYNNTHDSKAVKPVIKIKVGQVKEKQAYPLNKFLLANNEGYAKVINGNYRTSPPTEEFIDSFANLSKERDNGMGYQGQYVSDEVLNRRYQNPSLHARISEYNSNLGHSMGDSKASVISRKRLGEKINDSLEDMNYSIEGSSQIAAAAALTAAGMNEAASFVRKVTDDNTSGFAGTDSTATHPDKNTTNRIENLGEILRDAADKIYNGAELKSLALSDQRRAQLADYLFDEYIDGMINSTATMSPELKNILRAYKTIKSEDIPLPTATSKTEIKNFSIING